MNKLAKWIKSRAIRTFHYLNPASRRRVSEWETNGGVDFLRELGIEKGDIVADIGCGPGRYCIPAARVVGTRGAVYAVDRKRRFMKKVQARADSIGLTHLRTLPSMEALILELNGRKCNMAMLYDMLHFQDVEGRRKLYSGVRRILADNGLLSAHLKHAKNDEPERFFSSLTAEEIVAEIEASGYCLAKKISSGIWHAHGVAPGTVWNFIKKDQ